MSNIIEQSFGLNLKILSFCGLYPAEKNSLMKEMRMYSFYFLFMVMITFLMCVKAKTETNTDILETNFSVIALVQTISICLKVLPFLKNGYRIKKCINYFGSGKFAPRDIEEEKIIEECVRVCRRNSMFYFNGECVTVILWCIPLLANYQLPLEVWLPYDPTATPAAFFSTFSYLLSAIIYLIATDTTVPLMGGLLYHATCQLKILKYNLKNLEKIAKSGNKYSTVTFQFLKQCINRHNSVLDFVAEYEECFSFSMVCQFAASMFTVCFTCIGIILASAKFSIIRNVTLLIVANMQIVFYCFYGTLLFEENDTFGDAVYMSSWYTFDVEIRKILITVMERSKKPMIVSTGKVIDVTLQTFAAVLKTSYSLIAVFNKH